MTSANTHASEPGLQRLEFVGCDNLKLAADGIGNPEHPAILFAHGGGQTRHAWGGTARALEAKGFYAIVLDLRGHGDSSWCPDANYDLDYYARDLIEVAKTLGSKPHVVGASLGGLSAMLVEGKLAPGTFASLTMVDITPRMEEKGVDQIMGFMAAHSENGFASLDEAADSIAKFLPHRPRPKNTDGLSKNLRLGSDGRYRWHWDPAFVTNSVSARSARPSGRNDLDAVAAALKLPTHLVRGRLSQLVTEDAARHFLEVVPHAQFTDISDAGHMIAGDKNDVFTEAVASFMASL